MKRNYYSKLNYYRGISTWATKLLILAVTTMGLGFTVLLYSYKIYMDSLLDNYISHNILLTEYIDGIRQNDSRLLDYIRTNHLQSPSQQPYNWKDPSLHPGYNAVNTKVRKILDRLDRGFFVEARARDGEAYSNTRVLEVNHGWQGILIEPLPSNFLALQAKHRKAFLVNSCISAYPYPMSKLFPGPANFSISEPVRSLFWTYYKVQCFPLYSILAAAVNVSYIDYLSLDLDGIELDVLRTLPFESIFIKVISVKYTMIPEGSDTLRDYLVTKGYSLVGEGNSEYIFQWQLNEDSEEEDDDFETEGDDNKDADNGDTSKTTTKEHKTEDEEDGDEDIVIKVVSDSGNEEEEEEDDDFETEGDDNKDADSGDTSTTTNKEYKTEDEEDGGEDIVIKVVSDSGNEEEEDEEVENYVMSIEDK